jgi:hypothetical protein
MEYRGKKQPMERGPLCVAVQCSVTFVTLYVSTNTKLSASSLILRHCVKEAAFVFV